MHSFNDLIKQSSVEPSAKRIGTKIPRANYYFYKDYKERLGIHIVFESVKENEFLSYRRWIKTTKDTSRLSRKAIDTETK